MKLGGSKNRGKEEGRRGERMNKRMKDGERWEWRKEAGRRGDEKKGRKG